MRVLVGVALGLLAFPWRVVDALGFGWRMGARCLED